ncbi:cytochrome P450 [Microbacterium murale]|uniref:Cytochrome P450 n=1 Tax=Microbacterium murale TaxID=1081040 RepID=A0ABQ1RFW0_9MICO|nr:cytochrome P450 [Microbacterium murale]GGD65703.1 cytochrome P450 [Microbacterium murale]
MTTRTGVRPVTVDDLDLFSDDVLRSTQAVQDELRELAPVVYLPACELWAITRYDDIRSILNDPAIFSSQKVAFNDRMNDIMVGTTIATDPPDHKQLRDALMENLTPRALRGLKAEMEAKGAAHVRGLAGRGAFDGHSDFARDFVLSVVVDMIGVQGEERDLLLVWAEAALNAQGPLNERGRAGLPVAGGMFAWTRGRLTAEDLREGSLGRGIFAAADRGEIPYENRSILIEQIVVAGMETTIAALGNATILLGRNPEQYRMLREDATLIASAFAEVLRTMAPLPVIGRFVKDAVEVGGTVIPAGAQVALLLSAGNHDPRHYKDPQMFDITRNPTDHLSFGYGTHGCAGQGLARMESHALIAALVSQIKSFAVDEVTPRLNNIGRPYERIAIVDVVADS